MDDAPSLDFVISLSRDTTNLAHPIWPNNPILANWDIEDPPLTMGSAEEKRASFQRAMVQLDFYIDLLLMFPYDHFERYIVDQEINSFDLLWHTRQLASKDRNRVQECAS